MLWNTQRRGCAALIALAVGVAGSPAEAQTRTIVRFDTILGDIDVVLLDDVFPAVASDGNPGSVENFLNYVDDGDYTESFIHRVVPGFVVQGGGFAWPASSPNVLTVPTDPAILNEPSTSNTRGTVAYARSTPVNSATSQFFFNLNDNSGVATGFGGGNNLNGLDFQNQGFTAFAQVLDTASMEVIDLMASLQIVNAGSPFNQLPVVNPIAPGDPVLRDDLVFVNSVSVVSVESVPSQFTWQGGSGDWFGPAGWNAAILPADRDNVLINGGTVDALDRTVQIDNGGVVTLQSGTMMTSSLKIGSTGQFNFDGGRLEAVFVVGDVTQQDGTFAPGASPAIATWVGDYTLQAGTLEIELGGLAAGSQSDRLDVIGDMTLGGELDLSLISSFVPTVGDTYQIINATSVTGQFDTIDGAFVTNQIGLAVLYEVDGVSIRAARPGDLNFDGVIDGNDFGIFAGNFNTLSGAIWTQGDLNGDGAVNGNDFGIFAGNFDFGAASSSELAAFEAFAATVPEPGSLAALLFGGWWASRRRR